MGDSTTNNLSAQAFCDKINLSAFSKLQSYGVLLIIDKSTLEVIQYSENIYDVLKTPATDIQFTYIARFLTSANNAVNVHYWLMKSDKIYNEFVWNNGKSLLDVWIYIHQRDDKIILEIELKDDGSSNAQVFQLIDAVVNYKLDHVTESTDEFSKLLCESIQQTTDYDRVTLYQFLDDDSGYVLGEAIRNNMQSYLHLHFPPTDIPAPVRKMYLQQPLRYIPSIDDISIPIVPANDINNDSVVDLSDVMLRDVNPVHVEYMRNMQAVGSISIPIIHDNKLWGLISCHHQAAKTLSIYYRFGLLLLAKVLVKQLISINDRKNFLARTAIFEALESIQAYIYNTDDLFIEFKNIQNAILKMLAADGIAFCFQNKISLSDSTPNETEIHHLLNWLDENYHAQIYITHDLSSAYKPSEAYNKKVAGLLAIPLSSNLKDYLLVFRKETIFQISWAGDPDNVLIVNEKGYSPRISFTMSKKTVLHQSIKWQDYEEEAASSLQFSITSKLLQQILNERDDQLKEVESIEKLRVQLEREVFERTRQLNEKNIQLIDSLNQLQLLQDSIVQKEKMATIGQLAAGIAHEINNPLSYVINNVSLLAEHTDALSLMINYHNALVDELKNDPIYLKSVNLLKALEFQKNSKIARIQTNIHDMFSDSLEGLDRIKKIVASLQVFSNRVSENTDSVDINAAIKNAIEITKNTWKMNSIVSVNLSELPLIYVSLRQFELLCINFILNSAQSITENGAITISTTLVKSEIIIEFKDNGCGIPDDQISKLFTPFFTTKSADKSLGLGLAINYGIVKSFGGTITVETEVNVGTTFTVRLPVNKN